MDFYIFVITNCDPENKQKIAEITSENDNAVELGLSAGELRQSILDRLREEVENNEIENIEQVFEKLDLPLDITDNKEKLVDRIDELLYNLTDDELNNTIWELTEETIYIKGE